RVAELIDLLNLVLQVFALHAKELFRRPCHQGVIDVPPLPVIASRMWSTSLIKTVVPLDRTNEIAASIFGPIEPAGNSPAARYFSASATLKVSSWRCDGLP